MATKATTKAAGKPQTPGVALFRPGFYLVYVVDVETPTTLAQREFMTWADVCGFAHRQLADGNTIAGITVKYNQVVPMQRGEV